MKIKLLTLTLFTLTSIFSQSVIAQDYKDYLSPYWDSYYDNYPSNIEKAFNASDFIAIIDLTKFNPRTVSMFKGDVNLLKKTLYALDFPSLRQMSITGNFYSRSKKHDDYFNLYNLTYTKINKETWDKYCPYLIPLMEVDGLIKLH